MTQSNILKSMIRTYIKKYFPILAALFVAFFMYRISTLTPLAGDDWGYALNGIQENPFVLTLQFYMSWSGRIMSELYGFIMTPHKEIWNLLNAVLFGWLTYVIVKISTKKHTLLSSLVLIVLIFSVKDELRMETYTWLMGTTYVIPLVLALSYFYFIKDYIFSGNRLSNIKIFILSAISFYIGLTMENIAVAMVVAQIILIIYVFINEKRLDTFLTLQFIFSLTAFIILRMSPGSEFRLLRDYSEWIKIGVFEQLKYNYPNFINYTFIQNKMLVMIFSLILFIATNLFIYSHKKYRNLLLFSMPILALAIVSSMALSLQQFTVFEFLLPMTQSDSLFSLIFWPIFTITLLIILCIILENNQRDLAIFFILMAGLTNGAMMLSPIFGFRSSLYTVFFMFVVILILLDQIPILNWIQITLILLSLVFITKYSINLLYKYEMVARVQKMRLSQIEYYKVNPDVTDVWLIRFPINTIHAGDIEIDDTYHMDTFKEFYGLDLHQNLIFYFPDEDYETYLNKEGW